MASDKTPVDPLLYRLLVEQAKDYALFLLDREGRIMSWNAGAQRLKGYAADEIVGRHFSVFYSREAVESGWPQHELKVATAEGRFEDEGWRVRKDGKEFWARVIITALRDKDGTLRTDQPSWEDLPFRRLLGDPFGLHAYPLLLSISTLTVRRSHAGATFVLLKLIGLFSPLRVTEREEAMGLDIVSHGEEAYATGEGAILVEPIGKGVPERALREPAMAPVTS